jgi:hypothetical protein
VTFDTLVTAYGEAIRALAGGVDLFLVETIFDTLNGKAALFALESSFDELGRRFPVIVSGTITDASGRTLSGQTTEAFWNSVHHVQPLAVGLNCSLGAALMRPYIEEMARVAQTFVSCYPIAGLPNPMSDTGTTDATRDRARARGLRARWLRQPGGWLLRYDAGAYPRDRRGGERSAAARASIGRGSGGVERLAAMAANTGSGARAAPVRMVPEVATTSGASDRVTCARRAG